MNQRKRAWTLIIISAILTILMTCITLFCGVQSEWFMIGWRDDLYVVGVNINTSAKYWCLVLLIGVKTFLENAITEILGPILGFTVYNPDKKVITDFTKIELEFISNINYVLLGVRGVFSMGIYISQIDFMLWSVVFGEISNIFTVKFLLKTKEFNSQSINYVHI